MKRLAALLGAAFMVAAAFAIREQLDERSTSNDSAGSSSGGESVTVVCTTELADVCQAIASDNDDVVTRVEPAGTTLATLSSGDFDPATADIDAWLTIAPLPHMVAEARERLGRESTLGEPSEVLARSPLVIAVWNERRDALASSCPAGDITWRCIGEVAGLPWTDVGGEPSWGPVKPAHPQPIETAEGLTAMAGAVNSWFGNPDYALQDFRQPEFRAWFEQLERAIPEFPPPPRTPLDRMLQTSSPATFDLTGSLEAAAAPDVARSRDRDRMSIIYPSPVVVADVVLVDVRGASAGGRVDELAESDGTLDALARGGWRVTGKPLADGLPPDVELPPGTGLPRPGVLEALRSLWSEVRR